MSELTRKNWEGVFDGVINNCKDKHKLLVDSTCKKTEDLVNIFGNFHKDASAAKNKHLNKSFETEKGGIAEDMSFFQQQCNTNYNLLKNKITSDCNTFFNLKNVSYNKKIIIIVSSVVLISLFTFLSVFTQNKIVKSIWIILTILFCFVLFYFLYTIIF